MVFICHPLGRTKQSPDVRALLAGADGVDIINRGCQGKVFYEHLSFKSSILLCLGMALK